MNVVYNGTRQFFNKTFPLSKKSTVLIFHIQNSILHIYTRLQDNNIYAFKFIPRLLFNINTDKLVLFEFMYVQPLDIWRQITSSIIFLLKDLVMKPDTIFDREQVLRKRS